MYFKITTYCSSLPVAPVQKTVPSASCHLSSAGRRDQNPGIRQAQVSQERPSGLTRVTQAEPEQQNSFPPAYTEPAAICNNPLTNTQYDFNIVHIINKWKCTLCFLSLFVGQVHKSTVFNCRLTTSTPALSPQRPGSAHSEPVCLLQYNPLTMRAVDPLKMYNKSF